MISFLDLVTVPWTWLAFGDGFSHVYSCFLQLPLLGFPQSLSVSYNINPLPSTQCLWVGGPIQTSEIMKKSFKILVNKDQIRGLNGNGKNTIEIKFLKRYQTQWQFILHITFQCIHILYSYNLNIFCYFINYYLMN